MPFPYTPQLIEDAMSYSAYRRRVDAILESGEQPEAYGKYADYARSNVTLMDGYDETYAVGDSLKAALETAPPTTWLVITEGWCGDAAFSTPLLAKLEAAAPGRLKVRFVLRDEHLPLIDAHLTDGGRSIPIVVVLDEDLNEVGKWGPRPAALQTEMRGWKEEGLELKQIIPRVRRWYDADATQTTQNELLALVQGYSR